MLVEGRARRIELGDHGFRKASARDATLHLVRVAQILGQKIELLEDALDVRLEYRARPPRNDRWTRNTQYVGDGRNLREIGDLGRSTTYVAVGRIARSTTGRSSTFGPSTPLAVFFTAALIGTRLRSPLLALKTSDSPATSCTCGV